MKIVWKFIYEPRFDEFVQTDGDYFLCNEALDYDFSKKNVNVVTLFDSGEGERRFTVREVKWSLPIASIKGGEDVSLPIKLGNFLLSFQKSKVWSWTLSYE
jgi:hypothetical protein